MKQGKSGIAANNGGYAAISPRYRHTDRLKHNPNPSPVLKPPAASFTAGFKAFLIWVPFFNNPYRDNPQRGLWINGYKKAERETRMRDLWYMKGRERRYE